MRLFSDETASTATSNGQAIVDLVIDIADAILIGKLPGEFFVYRTDTFIFKAAKISTQVTGECGINNNVQLSNELLNIRSNNNSDYMNCAIMSIVTDIYSSASSNNTQFDDDYWQAPFFLLSVESENGYSDSQPRRLSGNNNNNSSNYTNGWLSDCEPILISLNSTNSLFWQNQTRYPSCAYFNETTQEYDNAGCYVLYSSDDATVCHCVHLTLFAVGWQQFEPQINLITKDLYQELTFENLWKYPLGWVVVLCWGLVCLSTMMILKYCHGCETSLVQDVPLIAQENVLLDRLILHNYVKNQNDKNWNDEYTAIPQNFDEQFETVFNEYLVIQELKVVKDPQLSRQSTCHKVFYLWKLKV